MDDDFHRSEAKVLDGEQNLVCDVLVVLLALNHSLLVTHVQRLLPAIEQCTYYRSSMVDYVIN